MQNTSIKSIISDVIDIADIITFEVTGFAKARDKTNCYSGSKIANCE